MSPLDRTPVEVCVVESSERWTAALRQTLARIEFRSCTWRVRTQGALPLLSEVRDSSAPALFLVETDELRFAESLRWTDRVSFMHHRMVIGALPSADKSAEAALREAGAAAVAESPRALAAILSSLLPRIEAEWRQVKVGLTVEQSLLRRLPWQPAR